MTVKYPNGKTFETKKPIGTQADKKIVSAKLHKSAANRGMGLEYDLNLSNEYYLEKNLCLVTKRPTPINIVKVDYTKGARITNAYFEKQSTTDYNGVYKGRYLDFEAKSTRSKTSFPLANISEHQIKHLSKVIEHGGIAFFIIEFALLNNDTYLLDASYIIDFINKEKRKSIPYEDVKKYGHQIKRGYSPRLDYLPIVQEVYFK